MFRRVVILFFIVQLYCIQSVLASDFSYDIKDGAYTVPAADLNSFGEYDSCKARPSSGSLFGAAICVVTPGIEDRFFVENRPDLSIYNTNKVTDLLNQFKQEELARRYGEDGSKLKEEYCRSQGISDYECENKISGLYNRETSTGVFQLNFRGLPIFAAFPYKIGEEEKDGKILVFSVPSLNVNKIFVGYDREDSVEKLKQYLKKDGSTILSELTKISPSPVTDAQKDMIKDDFAAGTQGDKGIALNNSVYIGAGYDARKYDNGETVKYLSLPLSMSIPVGLEDSRQELILRLPLQYSETNGEAKAYQVAGGISYKTPISYSDNPDNKNTWFLTPSFSYGMVGSKDQASVAQLVSTSLTSDFLLIDQPNYSISIGNLIGYQKTLPFEYKDWDLTVERTNVVTRNGVLLSLSLSPLTGSKILGMDLIAELFVIDTRAFGDKMYEDSYDEIGFTIGPKSDNAGKEEFVNASRQQLGFGFRYYRSAVSHGFSFSLNYEF